MNDKLVRLSDVIETVENQCTDGNMWGNENLTLIDASKTIDELSDIPTIDAAPIVHSWWEDCSNGWSCGHCHHDMRNEYPYCPWCGAHMDGRREEP